MKKTLIAMAAVAVAGVASAQVTLTGKLSYGYSTSHSNKEASGKVDDDAVGTLGDDAGTAAAKDVAGFGVHDGHFTIAASEDLGGGLSAAVSMEVLSRGRDTAISGRNASLTVSGGFGSVMMGAIEAGNGIMPLGQAGAPGIGLDGKVLSGAANVDIVKYTLPTVMEGLTLAASVTDAPGNTTGRSAGYSQGYSAAFASGALSASIDYTDYKNSAADAAAKNGSYLASNAATTLTAWTAGTMLPSGAIAVTAPTAAGKKTDSRVRMSFSYDFGVAKVGYGRQTVDYSTASNADDVQTTMGVSVPMGAITLGFSTAKQQIDGAATKKTGSDFGVKYELSKRTAVDFGRASWSTNTDSEKNKYQRIRLTHTF
jgi:predicted porin